MTFKLLIHYLLIACTVFFVGCAMNLPFNHQLASSRLSEARDLSTSRFEPISLEWFPVDFPNRVDVQGASGLIGWWTQTRIPTGTGLASRITKALDAAIGIDGKSKNVLQILVLNSVSKFEYSTGMFVITPVIDYGWCSFEAEFIYDGYKWRQAFVSEEKNASSGGSMQTGPLEKVWDNIALQVAKSVVTNLDKAQEAKNRKDPEQSRSREIEKSNEEQPRVKGNDSKK